MNYNQIPTELSEYAKKAYLGYAMSVVKGRAIPDVEDGLKPVQRRILLSMHNLGLKPTAQPMKSARVVGDCLGQYHPHGDGATYEAMVRMSQSFSLRYPLVHGEGNFGSREGDTAAAYRYTEAKLTPIAETLLKELGWDTVDYQPNYDGKEQEPVTLPSRLPMLLLNGSSGIGVGLATEFPPHQLNEVVNGAKLIIQKPKTTLKELMEVIPGPDYPTGSQIINTKDEIYKIYSEGRGSIRLRAKWRIEEDGKNWKIVFYEIPQTTNIEKIILEIDELVDPKPKEKNGKKMPLTLEQQRVKKIFGELIDGYDNHSDKEEPIRLVITPKNRKLDAGTIALALCAHTSLETNIPINFVGVDLQGSPKQMTILEWLSQWCEYRITTVRRRTQDEKNRIDARLHLLLGRLSILDHIQDVIKLLTTTEHPKQEIMDKYKLDEIQADDVLEMRLRQIAKLEKTKLLEEQANLIPQSEKLGQLLADDKLLKKLVIKELDEDTKQFGDQRRTLIQTAEVSDTKTIAEEMVQDKANNETMAIVLSERGWLGWRPSKTLEEAMQSDFKLKSGDTIRRLWFGNRAQTLLLLNQSGKGYSLNLTQLATKADSAPLTQWFETTTRIVEGALMSNGEEKYVLSNSGGYGFIITAKDWDGRMKAGKNIMKIEDGETIFEPLTINNKEQIFISMASDNKTVAFPVTDIKELPKGKGVILMGLGKGCRIKGTTLIEKTDGITLTTEHRTVDIPNEIVKKILITRDANKKGKFLDNTEIWEGIKPWKDLTTIIS